MQNISSETPADLVVPHTDEGAAPRTVGSAKALQREGGGTRFFSFTRRELPTALVIGLLLGTVLTLQSVGGAFRSELGDHPDESGHFVTGVMLREFLLSHQWRDPLRFAEDYYVHYPKVALGHWPPAFHTLQAAWELVLSPTTGSILVLVGLLAATAGAGVCLALRHECGLAIATACSLVVVTSPLVQQASGRVMAETLLAVLGLSATLAFGRFLDTGQTKHAVAFGVWALVAAFTKGNGLALGLVPLLAMVLARRWSLVFRPGLWLAALMVGALTAPWYWVTLPVVRPAFVGGSSPSVAYALKAMTFYGRELFGSLGGPLLVLSLIGFWARVGHPWKTSGVVEGRWAAAAALVIANVAFNCVVPSGWEGRHLVMSIPAQAMLVGAALTWLAGRGAWSCTVWRPAAATAMMVVFVGSGFVLYPKHWAGFSAPVAGLLADSALKGSMLLVGSDGRGEGMFLSEIVSREPSPTRVILRGSKVLARSGWNSTDYQMRFANAAEVRRYLGDQGVATVVLDTSVPAHGNAAHLGLLREAMEDAAGGWHLVGTYPIMREGRTTPDAIRTYRKSVADAVSRRAPDVDELLGNRPKPGQPR